jgi:hypothetical protein
MWRSILGIVAGVVIGGITVGLIEIPGYFIHPPPPGFDLNDAEAVKSHMATAPLAALLGIAIAWTIGPFVGTLVAAFIAGRAFLTHAMIIGVIFLLLDLVNVLSFPHPIWLAVIGVIAPPISAYFAAHLISRLKAPTGPQPYDMRERNMAC